MLKEINKNRSDRSRLYAAKLLFQYRFLGPRLAREKRLCEERIVVFAATSASTALVLAKQRGRSSQFTVDETPADPFRFEFVGVLELLRLGIETEPGDVWYDIRERLSPSERRPELIPSARNLSAFREERVVPANHAAHSRARVARRAKRARGSRAGTA